MSRFSETKLAAIGSRIFPRRLTIGLFGVLVAVFVVEPRTYHWGVTVGFTLLVCLGLSLRAWAAACAGNHTRDSSISAPHLVTGGPYARLRNPIYFGTAILSMGMVGLIGDIRLIPLAILVCLVLYVTIIPAEERFLEGKFGEPYIRYRKEVPRFWPSLRKWKGSEVVHPHWANARGELAIAGVLVVIYAILRIAPYLRQ